MHLRTALAIGLSIDLPIDLPVGHTDGRTYERERMVKVGTRMTHSYAQENRHPH